MVQKRLRTLIQVYTIMKLGSELFLRAFRTQA